MLPRQIELQNTYLAVVSESIFRLHAAKMFLARYETSRFVPEIESSILQVRKAFELIAYASIAPNKSRYQALRASQEQSDYTKDYHALRIFKNLSEINKDFYPIALLPATLQPDGIWHFQRKASGYLTKKCFEKFYNRIGKYMHAHNPLSNNKNLQNFEKDIPTNIEAALSLLELHGAVIRTQSFNGVWVVEARSDGIAPRIITGQALGDFVVQ